jgi:hypothetical protein
MKKYAEDSPYWDTTVHPAKSLGEIQELLDIFGADAIIVTQGKSNGKSAWLVRFQWKDRSYHFVFLPLPLRSPGRVYKVSGKSVMAEDRTRYQMGRIAMFFVKAILTAAEMNPDALFGFMELPGASNHSGIPQTAAQINITGLVDLLPEIDMPQLTDGVEQ